VSRTFALIPAAGTGTRFGSDTPKQYLHLAGKPILQHAIERLAHGLAPECIYVVLAQDDAWYAREIAARADVTVMHCGGATRAQTVGNALRAMPNARRDDWIAVHDAVRPCVDRESLRRLQREIADDAVGGLLAIPAAATLKRGDDHARVIRTEPREHIWLAQTPQMFRYGVLLEALTQPGAADATDEAQAVEALGLHPRLVRGSATNLKVTFPDDLRLAEAILRTQAPKS